MSGEELRGAGRKEGRQRVSTGTGKGKCSHDSLLCRHSLMDTGGGRKRKGGAERGRERREGEMEQERLMGKQD